MAWHDARIRADAHPDCPTYFTPVDSPEGFRQFWAFMEEQGVWKLADRANELNKQRGAAAKAIFAVPANTVRGALGKLEIVRLAIGDIGEGGDMDLECFQDHNATWFAAVIGDLERLAGDVS